MFEVFKELKSTNSNKEKLKILTKYKSCYPELEKIFFYTYNPFYNYYIKKQKLFYDNNSKIDNCIFLKQAFELLDKLNNREITGNEARNTISNLMKTFNKEQSELFLKILKRDLKIGISATTINKIYPNLIKKFNVMLATDSKHIKDIDKILEYEKFMYVQKKCDGQRTIIFVKNKEIIFYSRSGKEIENLYNHEALINNIKTISNYFDYDFVLDGEILLINNKNNDESRQLSNGMINRLNLPKEILDKFKFFVWDIIPLNEFLNGRSKLAYEERLYNILHYIGSDKYSNIELVETHTIYSMEEINKLYNSYLEKGSEGIILKTNTHKYETKRSKNWIKFKNSLEVDLRVVKFNYGSENTKYENCLGALEAEDFSGNLKVSVGSGFSDQQRKDIKENEIIGKIITIKYNEIIKNNNGYSLYLPVFIEIRNDKTEPNNLQDLI